MKIPGRARWSGGSTAPVVWSFYLQKEHADGKAKPGLVDAVLGDIRALAAGVRGARR